MREMKDSGVEWIGEIPKDWNCMRLKFAFDNSNVGESIDKEFYSSDEKGYIFYTAGANPVKTSYTEFPMWKYTTDNDILLARNGTPYIYLPSKDAVYSDHIIRINIKDGYCRRFLRYCLQRSIESIIVDSVSIATWSISLWKEQKLPLPYYHEQKYLADYLDIKCSKIDEIIEKQQVIIEKLKEYKLSIITEAVTKGLNPDAEMKDSGNIEIGKIPSISRPTKLKYLCNTQGRIGFKGYTTTDLVDEGEGAYTLGASHLNNGKIDLTDPVFISWEKYYESPEIMVKQNDILIVQRGSTIGKVAIVDKNYGEVTINPSLVLINKIHIDSKYLLYALSARYIANYINLIGTTTAIPMISQKQINDLVVIVPPDSIQISVVKYLDEKCGKIDANILKKQKLIDNLLEYKKSLIYEVVTGKKEV